MVLRHVSTNDLGIGSRFAYRNFSDYWAEKNWRIVLKKLDKRAEKPGVPFSQDSITRRQYNVTRAHAMAQIKKQFAKRPSAEKGSVNYQGLQAGHKEMMSGHREKRQTLRWGTQTETQPNKQPSCACQPRGSARSCGPACVGFPVSLHRAQIPTSAAVLPSVRNHQASPWVISRQKVAPQPNHLPTVTTLCGNRNFEGKEWRHLLSKLKLELMLL